MITKVDRKALEDRRESPDTLAMMQDLHKKSKDKVRLTYPDGREKIVSGDGINIQKLMRHCDATGVTAELIKA